MHGLYFDKASQLKIFITGSSHACWGVPWTYWVIACSQTMIVEIQCQVDGVAISIRHGVTSLGTEEKRRK